MEIQQYNDRYKQQVIDLILTIQRDEFGVPVTLDDQPDIQDIPAFYQHGNGNFWIAVVDGMPAGTIGLLDSGNTIITLRKMFVKKEFRGKQFGVGQALLDVALIWAKEHKLQEVYLGTTDHFMAAQRFYEKNGFTAVDKDNLPAAFPRMPVDHKFYRYSV